MRIQQPTILAVIAIITGIGLMASSCHLASVQPAGSSDSGFQMLGVVDETESVSGLPEIPETLEQEIVLSDGSLKVQIDAQVIRPETDSVPVAGLIYEDISEATEEAWLGFLSEGKTLYHSRDIGGFDGNRPIMPEEQYAKGELTRIIDYYKSGNYLEYYSDDVEKNSVAWGVAREIERLEGLYSSAPETPDRRLYSAGDTPLVNPEYGLKLEADLGRARPASFWLPGRQANPFANESHLLFQNTNTPMPITPTTAGKPDPDYQKTPEIAMEEAQKVAEQYAVGLGFTDFQVSGAGLTVDWDRGELETEYGEGIIYNWNQVPLLYVFYLTRTIGGLNETYTDWTWRNYDNDYNGTLRPECLEIAVSDAGVQSVCYRGVPVKTEVLIDQADILEFDEIITRFSEEVYARGVLGSGEEGFCDENIVERRVLIDRIELGGLRVQSPEDSEQNFDGDGDYTFVPVWTFFGAVTEKWAEGTGDTNQQDENNEFTYDALGQAILTINAMDGSVISRSMGG